MKNILIAVLAVALVAALVLSAVFYSRHQDAENRIRIKEQELARLTEDLAQTLARLSANSNEQGGKSLAASEVARLAAENLALVDELKKTIQDQAVTINNFKDNVSITMVDRILFDFARATITPTGRRILEKTADALKRAGDRRIKVIGHTDNRPILDHRRHVFASNWELSTDRACAVVRFFQEQGLDPARMEAIGRSFHQPEAGNDTLEGRAKNRRVEIIIAPRLTDREAP